MRFFFTISHKPIKLIINKGKAIYGTIINYDFITFVFLLIEFFSMLFKDVIGQEETKKKLIKTVKDNRVSHAQLFSGPEGAGSLPLAIAYAQYLSCGNRNGDDSCGTCPSCNKYAKLIHPDLHFILPVASTPKVKDPLTDKFLEEWRKSFIENPYLNPAAWYKAIGLENKQGFINVKESSEIIRKLSLKTYESEFKVVIIWLPEKMNDQTANKLLKIIEEPPSKTLFLMITGNSGNILPTIYSRAQMIKIPKLDEAEIFSALKQKYDFEEVKIKDAAHLADGNWLKALNLLEKTEESMLHFEKFTALMRLCWIRDMLGLLNWVEEMSRLGRESQKLFLDYGLRIIRENFIMNINPETSGEMIRMTRYESDFSVKFSKFINKNNIFGIASEFNQACLHIEANANGKIVFHDMANRLAKLIKQ